MARFLVLIRLFLALITAGSIQPAHQIEIPKTGYTGNAASQSQSISHFPSLREFIPTIKNGNAKQLVGVFVNDTLALRVVQQPSSNTGFVSADPQVVTQFSLASQYGSTGLLAHNTAAGEYFADIAAGQRIVLVYGNGNLRYYSVGQIRKFKALTPDSPYSDFVDITSPEKILSAENLFYQVYQSHGDLVFQTCIEENGLSSWGRLFIIAHPITPATRYSRALINYLAVSIR